MISCPHYTRELGNKHNGICDLGWASGKPFIGECLRCIKESRNTPEAYAAAQARHALTHPAGVPRVSGCCDSALNPPPV
jgi:hypothetical protein